MRAKNLESISFNLGMCRLGPVLILQEITSLYRSILMLMLMLVFTYIQRASFIHSSVLTHPSNHLPAHSIVYSIQSFTHPLGLSPRVY
jgi:hypothetical protein